MNFIKRNEYGDVTEPLLIIGGLAISAILLIQLFFGLMSTYQDKSNDLKKDDKNVIQEQDPRYRD